MQLKDALYDYQNWRRLFGYLDNPRRLLSKLGVSVLFTAGFEFLFLTLFVVFLSMVKGGVASGGRYQEFTHLFIKKLSTLNQLPPEITIIFLLAISLSLREVFVVFTTLLNRIGMSTIEKNIRVGLLSAALHANCNVTGRVGSGTFVELGSLAAIESGKLFQVVTNALKFFITLLSYFAFLLLTFYEAALLGLLVFGLFALVAGFVAKTIRRYSAKAVHEGLEFSQSAERVYALRRNIKIDGLVEKELNDVSQRVGHIVRIMFRSEKLAVLLRTCSNLILYLALFGFVGISQHLGLLEITAIASAIVIAMRLTPLLMNFSRLRNVVANNMPRFEKVDQLICNLKLHREEDGEPSMVVPKNMQINFENVNFTYPTGGKQILFDINLSFRKEEFVILAGSSGSGKSTLIDLLTCIETPTDGAISINKHDIKNFRISDYRNLFSFVGQEPILFDGTLRKNLTLRQPDLSESAVTAMLEQIGLLQMIQDMDLGLDTIIGERGIKMSGGQKQRVALAGAFLKASNFLILDEPTSALDKENEQAIVGVIKDQVRHEGKTAIVITHNWEVAKHADRVIRLDGGRVVYNSTPNKNHFLSVLEK